MMRTIAFLGMLIFCAQAYGEDVTVVPGVEGLAELEEEGITSRLKFRNAEVIVTLQHETKPADPASTEKPRVSQQQVRVLLDFENERCFYVSAWQQSDNSSPSSKCYYVTYRDGKGTDNIGVAVSEPGRDGFFKYMGENDVWHVELAGVGYGQNNAVRAPEENSEKELQRVREFKLVDPSRISLSTRIHPNGNKEYIREWTNTGNKTTSIYNPKFALPIEQIAIRLFNGKAEELLHTKAEFEDVDGFARCKSFTKDMLTLPLPETFEKEHTTTQYQWLQFNEETLKWPDEQQIIASDESMRDFLVAQ